MNNQKYMSYEQYLVDVKKGIVTDQGNCPVTPLLQKLQGKWKSQILYELCIHDPARFGEIKKDLPGISTHYAVQCSERIGRGRLYQARTI